jgi:hypothetical protein
MLKCRYCAEVSCSVVQAVLNLTKNMKITKLLKFYNQAPDFDDMSSFLLVGHR